MDKEAFRHYTLDIPDIDDEHWQLIALMDQINQDARDENQAKAREDIAELRRLLILHFEREEAPMKEIGFPYIASHVDSHKQILFGLEKMCTCTSKYRYYNGCASFLVQALVDHVDHTDMQYAPYYKEWLKNKERGLV